MVYRLATSFMAIVDLGQFRFVSRWFWTELEAQNWEREMNRLVRRTDSLFRYPDPGSQLEKLFHDYGEMELFLRGLEADRKRLKDNAIVLYRCRKKNCFLAALLSIPGGTLWVYSQHVRVQPDYEVDGEGGLRTVQDDSWGGIDDLNIHICEDPEISTLNCPRCARDQIKGDLMGTFEPKNVADFFDATKIDDSLDYSVKSGLSLYAPDHPAYFGMIPVPIGNCRHASTSSDIEQLLRDVEQVRGKKNNVIYL